MKKKLPKKLEHIIDKLGWKISYGWWDDGSTWVELENWSELGEDLVFTFSVDDFVKDVQDYYDDFNPEEHAVEVWQAGKRWRESNGKEGLDGVPESIRALLKDADGIDEQLLELEKAVSR